MGSSHIKCIFSLLLLCKISAINNQRDFAPFEEKVFDLFTPDPMLESNKSLL